MIDERIFNGAPAFKLSPNADFISVAATLRKCLPSTGNLESSMTRLGFVRRCLLGTGALLITLLSMVSQAIDIPPGQAIAPPPGKSALRFELNAFKLGDQYHYGKALGTGANIRFETLGIQYSRSLQVKNRLLGFYVNGSLARARPGGTLSGLPKVSGLTDSAAALVTWLHADPEKGRYAVLGTFMVLPTGHYDSDRAINLGNNRLAGGLQLGYHTRLAKNWDAMLTSDVTFSAKNNDYRLTHQDYKQKPLYSMQFSLMHHIDSTLMLSGTYYRYRGGEGRLNGAPLDNPINRHRYEMVLSKRVKSGKYELYLGKDSSTYNGLIEKYRLSFRYQYYF